MEPPTSPVDIKIVLGDEEGQQNLLHLDFDLQIGQPAANQLKQKLKITQSFNNDLMLIFDFHVESGREKDATQYFNQAFKDENAEGLSPLQKIFAQRPSENSEKGKFVIEQYPGFVRIIYRFFYDGELTQMNQQFEQFLSTGFNPSTHVSLDLKGFVAHNKKNRTNVKVNYTKIEASSHTFSSAQMLDSLSGVGMFEYEPELISNPVFDLMKKSKKAKVNLKMSSFRKISKFFEEVSEQQQKKHSVKEFPYTNKGILRQKAGFNFAFGPYVGTLDIKYESEDVFVRLIKVYLTMLHKQLDIDLTSHWW